MTALALALSVSACVLAHPVRAVVGTPPADLGGSKVQFASRSGGTIHAWFVPASARLGAVLLLHGMGANRTSMLERARFLHARGYAVLAPDFQAEGESSGDHVTFGKLESLDAEAALAFLRDRVPGERIGVIGVSMGGAAALVGSSPLSADAMVLESVYPTFGDAVADRFGTWLGPFGIVGRLLAP